MGNTIKTMLWMAVALVFSLQLHAQTATNQFNLPSQPLSESLKAVAATTNVNVLFDSDEIATQVAPELRGNVTLDQALTALLVGSGLKPRYLDEKTVVLERARGAAKTSSIAEWELEGMKQLAQAESGGTSRAETEDEPLQAGASDAEKGEDTKLEEIVVTAQKRVERLQDVPISMTVLGGDDLDRSTLQGVAEALNTVAGVTTDEEWNGMGPRVRVRGVGPQGLLFNGSSPIGYYLDSVPFAFVKSALVPDANPYDLDRVEVLRGPQGTLYGASSLNGVVRILTHDADLDEFQFKARALGATTEEGSGNYRGDMAINVPLIEGKLAARLVAGHQNMGGWIDKPRLGREDANDSEVNTARLKLKAQPSGRFSAEWVSWLSRTDNAESNSGDAHLQRSSSIEEPNFADYDMHVLKLGYDLDSFTVTGTSSYLKLDTNSLLDFEPFCCTNLAGDSTQGSKVLAHEILASSRGEGAWRWSLGALYRDVRDHAEQFLVDYAHQPLGDVTFWDETSESVAVYGELTRLMMDGRLGLTAGLRWFHDQVTARGTGSFSPGAGIDSDSETFRKLTPRVVVTGHISDDVMVYASYSQGFRSGALQQPVLDVEVAAEPDVLTNYEVGTKGAFWDGVLSLDASVYFIDWQKVQQPIQTAIPLPDGNTSLAPVFTNGPSASGMGVDLALTVRPMPGLSLGATLGINDLEFDANVVAATGIPFRKGERLNLSPRETYGAFVDYEFPLGNAGYRSAFAASANYTSRVQAGEGGLYQFSDPQLISRLSFSVLAPQNWEAMIFVNNLTDERGISSPVGLPIPDWDTRTRPRTFGVQIQYHFQ